MDFKLKVLPRATLEIEEAIAWYASKNPELRNGLLKEIHIVLGYLVFDPYLFKKTKRDYRQVPLKRFPYIIIYRVSGDEILIQSVFNTHQNPNKKP